MNTRFIQIKQMLEDSPDDSFLLYALAKEYEKNEKLDKALEVFLKLKNIDPEYTGLYYHLGGLYAKLQEPEKALQIYKEGIQVCKKKSDFHALSELNNAKTNLELEI